MIVAKVVRLQLVEVILEAVKIESLDASKGTYFQDPFSNHQIIQIDVILNG